KLRRARPFLQRGRAGEKWCGCSVGTQIDGVGWASLRAITRRVRWARVGRSRRVAWGGVRQNGTGPGLSAVLWVAAASHLPVLLVGGISGGVSGRILLALLLSVLRPLLLRLSVSISVSVPLSVSELLPVSVRRSGVRHARAGVSVSTERISAERISARHHALPRCDSASGQHRSAFRHNFAESHTAQLLRASVEPEYPA